MVVINDVELAMFVFPEDLDEVIDERVVIVNDVAEYAAIRNMTQSGSSSS